MEKSNFNSEMVEATINQLIAEIRQNLIDLQEKLKHFPDSDSIKGEIKGLRYSLNRLRMLNSSIQWKQVQINSKN
tara:strand:- start:711 stop:935 length:225 start_codon:yes stop_codon:yes gene_type:complete